MNKCREKKILWGLEKTAQFGQSSDREAKVTEKQAEIAGRNQNVKDFHAPP